eukprot:TRINITY_DN93179_c0_g1_i1.p1 TRINITY_DN93179_c0_g1~~TRINITY_DN93179_c0_g1_i1.p1  ORF type:complete len:658 (+),score=97.34 TRINITY_DN93179_c0_g1_i1:140-2113(+)
MSQSTDISQTGKLGQLGGILDSFDAQAGAARAVVRTAAADGASASSRLVDTLGRSLQLPVGALSSPCLSEIAGSEDLGKVRSPKSGQGSSVSDEVDSLVHQLARGEGDFFNYVDKSKTLPGNKCVVCKSDYNQTALVDGRHEIKVLPCFHSICAVCLQTIVEKSEETTFQCPACDRTTQKMQNLHEYLAHYEVLSNMDKEAMAQSDFKCEECVSSSFAQTYCEDCVMHLCDPCSRHHRRAKNTCRHTLVELKDRLHHDALHHRAQFCAIHRTDRYELYCHDCELLICPQCAREDHQQHSYKLPSASLIENQRQRVKTIVDHLCNKLLDDQAMQKVLHHRHEQELAACDQARANIATAFGELQRAAEERCRALIHDSEENSKESRQQLEEEKRRCSTALVDIWRAIEFTEKVVDRGTDVEVLMARGHMFREGLHTQQLQDWNRISMAPPPPGLARKPGAGWTSSREADAMLGSLATFGSVQFDSCCAPSTPAVTDSTKSMRWADVFEEACLQGFGVAPATSSQLHGAQSTQEDLPNMSRSLHKRKQRPLGSSQSLALMGEPVWIHDEQVMPRAVSLNSIADYQCCSSVPESVTVLNGERSDQQLRNPSERSNKDKDGYEGDEKAEADAGSATVRHTRRRRPRGRGGKAGVAATRAQGA